MTRDCTGSALVYSGRPDPVWTITRRHRTTLARLWASLAPSSTGPPPAPVLGYKGATMECPSGERWSAYGGVATLIDSHSVEEFRADPEHHFERAILNSAPKGAVPVQF